MIQTFKVSIFSLKVQREVSSCLYQSAVLCFTGPCVVYSSFCSHYYGAGQNVGQSINTVLIPWRLESTFRTIVKHLSGMKVSKNKRERESGVTRMWEQSCFLVVHNLQMDGPFLGSYTGQHYNHCENIIHFAAVSDQWSSPALHSSNVNIAYTATQLIS